MKTLLTFAGPLAALALTLTLAGCQDVVKLNVPAGQPLLAVDGAITDQPGPYVVRLTQTAPYFTNEAAPAVTGAVVVLTDNNGGRETLREGRPGEYVTTGSLRGKVGGQYTLTIDTQGEQYAASTEIRRAVGIDSVGYKYEAASGFIDGGYTILYNGQEPAGVGDYYRFEVFQNDVLRNKPADLFTRSDELVDGNYLRSLELNGGPGQVQFVKGDRVKVEIQSITADYYHFLNELSTQINNAGLFAAPPANVRTNVHNLTPGSSRQAVGYFAGYTVRADSVVLR
ncbi:MAG: DUF4249 domain-containing protein [Bacteroidota bacterium]|nr:DUF4249 domain-containing protein [Bacteroidota bacterium]